MVSREKEGRSQFTRGARRELLRRAQLTNQREEERSRSRSHSPAERREDTLTNKSSEPSATWPDAAAENGNNDDDLYVELTCEMQAEDIYYITGEAQKCGAYVVNHARRKNIEVNVKKLNHAEMENCGPQTYTHCHCIWTNDQQTSDKGYSQRMFPEPDEGAKRQAEATEDVHYAHVAIDTIMSWKCAKR